MKLYKFTLMDYVVCTFVLGVIVSLIMLWPPPIEPFVNGEKKPAKPRTWATKHGTIEEIQIDGVKYLILTTNTGCSIIPKVDQSMVVAEKQG